jgi:multisubunit Na+/H+ antiporter MnhC subunit
MSAGRVFFMIFYGVLALIGLFAAAASKDLGMSIFGWGLLLFGVLNAYRTIGAHYSEQQGH